MAKIIKTLKTSLKGSLSSTGLSFKVQKFVDSKDNVVAYSDFGGNFVVVFEQGTKIEMILCTGITQNLDGTATITINSSGRHLDPKSPYAGGATGLSFTTGASIIVTNDPYTLSKFAHTENDNAFTGDNSFTNFPTKVGTGIATANDEFMTYGHALSLLTGSANINQILISSIAGENLTDGDLVYFKESDQKWWKASASASATSQGVKLGIAQEIALADASVNIFTGGLDSTQTGMTAGAKMYLGDTAGSISNTAGTNEVFIGWAKSATELLWGHNEDLETITAKEKDALQTPSGLELSTDNRVIDEGSVSNGATMTASTIAFVNSNPDTITDSANGFVTAGFRRGQAITISGSASNDGTYTIKSVVAGTITLIATDSLTVEAVGASVTISADKENKIAQFDPNGELPIELAQTLTAYEGLTAGDLVKHINDSGTAKMQKLLGEYPDSAGTDTVNAESSGMGTNVSDEALRAVALDSSTVVVVYDDDSASNYAYAQVLSIATDGSITVGAKTTVSSVNTNNEISIAKVSATKVAVGYYNAGTIYYKVGTVSGTTITFGSATSFGTKVESICSAYIEDDKFVALSHDTTAIEAKIGTVSGTTITFGASQTVSETTIRTGNKAMQVAVLSTTLFAIAYHASNSNSEVRVATISGTTIGTFGASQTVSTIDATGVVGIARVSDTKFVFAYINGFSYLKAQIGTVSGTTITLGGEQSIRDISSCRYATVEVWSGVVAIFKYYRTEVGEYVIADISGDTITATTAGTFDASLTYGVGDCLKLSSTRSFVVWADGNNPAYAKTIDYTPKDDRGDMVGVVEETIATDATGKVAVARGDKAQGQTLTAGAMYYAQSDGTLGTTETAYKVGIALSTTELLLLI